jgi:hypothetical protein
MRSRAWRGVRRQRLEGRVDELELVIGASRLGGYAVARQPVISAQISKALARAIRY